MELTLGCSIDKIELMLFSLFNRFYLLGWVIMWTLRTGGFYFLWRCICFNIFIEMQFAFLKVSYQMELGH